MMSEVAFGFCTTTGAGGTSGNSDTHDHNQLNLQDSNNNGYSPTGFTLTSPLVSIPSGCPSSPANTSKQ